MNQLAHLPPSSPSLCRFFFAVHRRHYRAFSATPDLRPDPGDDRTPSSIVRWISAIAAGSSLGFVYWFSSTAPGDFKKTFSFSDWRTAISEAVVQPGPSSSPSRISLSEKNPKFLFGDAFRRKIFFNYEKRMRTCSPPEKVFAYFATSQNSDGEMLMKPADLMRAVVPVFPPSESNLVRDGYLRGERSPGELRCDPSEFFMLFDMNTDGLISFKEYIFFVTLLSIPESSFSVVFKMFDTNSNGEIDRKEFKKVMTLMRAHNRQGAVHRNGLRAGLKGCGSVENGGLVEYFFGKDGKDCLQHDKFIQFLRDLHEEMLRLEFDHYDYKLRGTISAKDFALSMVASADMKDLHKLLDRVDELDNYHKLSSIRITYDEFKNFAELRKKLHPFSVALFSHGKVNGLLTRHDFQRAASHVCGISLSDSVLEVIFHVFDANHDGNLSSDEFLRVLHKRERDIAQPTETGIRSLLSNSWDCTKNSSFARLLC